ncbi:hypothetical protein AAHC03_05295 [Spirometra sp. Aus1]
MSVDIVTALSRFSDTLSDGTVEGSAKLKVLGTLNEVALTLSELSRSGVGRAVRRLKGEPGELGKAARNLLLKWKSLLDEHIKRENIVIESSVHKNRANPPSNRSSNKEPSEITPKKKPKLVKSDKPDYEIAVKSANGFHAHLPHSSSEDSLAGQKHRNNEKRKTELPTTLSRSNAIPAVTGETLSLDSSSGLSFEESLFMSSTVSKKPKHKKHKTSKSSHLPSSDPLPSSSREFAEEVLNSLAEPVDRPDAYVQKASVRAEGTYKGGEDTDDDDGTLKFKSKKVMWAPRAKKPNKSPEDGAFTAYTLLSPTRYQPQSLVDLCLCVIEKNISLVDHVGLVPFELFSRVLTNASAEDLARIEKHNPQFNGLTDDYWRRHVQRDFPEYKNMTPRYKETWANMYSRLATERSKRLDRFIHRSASKLKAEREMRRTTLTTDVITPTQIQRRAAREANLHSSFSAKRSSAPHGRQHNPAPTKMVFKPRNMSMPTPPAASQSSAAHTPSTTVGGGNLLGKLRKQFLKGR